ncbi:Beta-glucanase/Beta-glucan synthetase [Nocardioides sp. J9]|nr:Beta-glucanase/Beta-glucan synthetase [Nocardioides sp. J9]
MGAPDAIAAAAPGERSRAAAVPRCARRGAVAAVLLALLAAATHLVAPAEAAVQRVRIGSTTYLAHGKVRLTGATSASVKKVWVEARRSGRWLRITATTPVKRKKFSLTIARRASAQRVRVASGNARSPARTIRALESDACGVRPFKPNGTTWRCTLAENFDGTTLDRTLWKPQTNFATGDALRAACYIDSPDVISVSGGRLRLSVREAEGLGLQLCTALLPSPITRYVAGMVSTYHRFTQQYGRFEARMKSPVVGVPGFQESFWLWPGDRVPTAVKWPAAGEIDVVETYSVHPDLAIPFLHYTANDNGGPVPGLNTAYCHAPRGEFHRYTLVWRPRTIEVYVDGRLCLRNTSADAAFQKPYILLFTQALGTAENAFRGGARLPVTMEVDYVRAWQ